MRPHRDHPEIPKHRSSKDRGHWCRGKEGVPHDYQYQEDRNTHRVGLLPTGMVESIRRCAACGKKWWSPDPRKWPSHLHPRQECAIGCQSDAKARWEAGCYWNHPHAWVYGPAF